MSFTANDVKTLRERTGAGMMDCKKALTDCQGNMEAAIDFLKKQGLAKAVSKSGRVAAEGLIFSKIEGATGLLVELNCETDFVAKNDDFLKLGKEIADAIFTAKPASQEEALKLSVGGQSIEERTNGLTAVIGERIHMRRFEFFTAKKGGKLGGYVHGGGKIVVIMEVTGSAVTDDVIKDLCMQVTAMNPQFVDKSEVPADVIEREKAIRIEQLKESGKPADMLEKIVVGQMNKFAGEISLNQQIFFKDAAGKLSCQDHLKKVDPQASIVSFMRLQVGEGVEKKKDNFAEEVAKMAQG